MQIALNFSYLLPYVTLKQNFTNTNSLQCIKIYDRKNIQILRKFGGQRKSGLTHKSTKTGVVRYTIIQSL